MNNLVSLNVVRKAKQQKILDLKASTEILQNTLKMLDSNDLEETKYIKKQIKISIGLLKKEIRKKSNEN